MTNYPTTTNIYFAHWKKYRPALVKLMGDALEAPQEYKFSKHEFTDINAKEKGGHAFTLQMFNGKAANNIKTSIVAQDLLVLLQSSNKASELTREATFEFAMDKQSVLRVTSIKTEEETEEVETSDEESIEKEATDQ